MAVYEYRQGTGEVKRIAALGPTTREDGSVLEVSEVALYLMGISYNGGDVLESAVNLIENASTPEYDGEFDEVLNIDDLTVGVYSITYKTVDVGGLQSRPSDPLVLEILAAFPKAPPTPPVVS